MNRYSLADIEYEPVQIRMARLMDERQDTVSDILATFGPDPDYKDELAFIKKLKTTYMALWNTEQRAYAFGLIEAEDEIIESSYT